MGTVPSSFEGEGVDRDSELPEPAWSTPSAARCRPHRKDWPKQTAPAHDPPSAVIPTDLVYPRRESAADSAEQSGANGVGKATGSEGSGGSESAPNLLLLLGEPGYEWTQYGTKPIAGGQRLYQKCRVAGCGVKKIVEVLDDAPEGSEGSVNKEKFDGEHTHGPATITLKAESTESLRELVWRASSSKEEARGEEPVGIKTVFMECSPTTNIFGDGFAWRKYGEKKVKGCKFKRSYYRCSSNKQCPARKTVEQLDGGRCRVTYKDVHIHACPGGPPQSLDSPRGALLMMPSRAPPVESIPPRPPPLLREEERLAASQAPVMKVDPLLEQQPQQLQQLHAIGQRQMQPQQQTHDQQVDPASEEQHTAQNVGGLVLPHAVEQSGCFPESSHLQSYQQESYARQGQDSSRQEAGDQASSAGVQRLEEEQMQLAVEEPLMQAPVQAFHIVEDGDHNMLFAAELNYNSDEQMVMNGSNKRKRLQEAAMAAKRRRPGLT